ncbi:MAG: hypothetical protein J6C46_02445 [Clostridia bacterium]|nr:hypothetical protein [Clostridia bacterium]
MEFIIDMAKDLWWVIKPTNATNALGMLATIVFFVVVFITRKHFGGFGKAFFAHLWALIVLIILNAISPWLMYGAVALGLLVAVFPKSTKLVKGLIIFGVIAGAVLLAILKV